MGWPENCPRLSCKLVAFVHHWRAHPKLHSDFFFHLKTCLSTLSMWTNDRKYRAPFKVATTATKTAENISKLDRTHRLQLCKFLANDDDNNTLSSVAQLSKPQCSPVTTYFRNQHFSVMQICAVLKTKVEFSNRAGDNEPQRRYRAPPCRRFYSEISFLPTASVYFLLWLLSLMFSTRHATTDVAHSFILMRRSSLWDDKHIPAMP